MNRLAFRSLPAALTSLFACAAAAPAQVPNDAVVLSLFQGNSTSSIRGGISWFDFAAPRALQPIRGLPLELTGRNSGLGVEGSGSILVDQRTGNLVVGEHALGGHSTDIHVLTLSGNNVVRDDVYPLGTKPSGIGSVDQMAWLGDDVVFTVRGPAMTSGVMMGHKLGILRPRLGPPGTPGTVVPIPLTTPIAGIPNALAVDADRGVAYFSRNSRAAGRSDIYRVPVPGDGVTPVTPVLVASIPGGILNLALESSDQLLVGCGTDWGAGIPLYRVDLSMPTTSVAPVNVQLNNVNALTVDAVGGDALVCDSFTGNVHLLAPGGTPTLLRNIWGGALSGIAIRQPLATFGPPTDATPRHTWRLAPNAGGAPRVGNAGFSLTLDSSTANTTGFVGIAAAEPTAPLSILGMRVLIDPASMVVLPTTLPGTNSSTIQLPIPNEPGLVDAQILVQTFHLGAGVWTASRGLRMTLQ